MRQTLALSFAGLLAAAGTSAHAYTPESGTWWNPDRSGTGVMIEVQDNFLFAAVYTYDLFGNPIWYTAAGFLDGNAHFEGQLDAFDSGPCIACAYRPNRYLGPLGGAVEIDFDPNDPSKGQLTWGGQAPMPIEHNRFYLQRPEDALAGKPFQLTRMLGEWQMVLDFSSNPDVFPYYGELLVFDNIDISASTDFLEGCRADNSLDGFCSNIAFRDHEASGFYDAATGEHVVVVENDPSTYAMYVLRAGTDHVQGEVSVYARGGQPGTYYPVRGFRSASRTFVEEGVGPSKRAADESQPSHGERPGLPLASLAATGSAVSGSKIAQPRLLEIARQLEQRLSITSR